MAKRGPAVPGPAVLTAALDECCEGVAVEQDGEILWASAACDKLLGQPIISDAHPMSVVELMGAAQEKHLRIRKKQLRQGGQSWRLHLLRPPGEVISPQQREAQRLEMLGRLVGGVAHDFNNLLTAVALFSDLLVHHRGADNDSRRYGEEIALLAQRGATFVRQLLVIARRTPSQMQVVSPSEMLNQMSDMLRRLIGENITLHMQCAHDTDCIKADVSQLSTLMLNLVTNACDAMPNGGDIWISTTNVQLTPQAAKRAGLPLGQYLRLQVRDNGSGMDATTLSRVWEPFFTTKPGKGTGLGLPMVRSVAMQSGGAVSLHSQPGMGTAVQILFPRVDGETAVAPQESVEQRSESGRRATILLAEDDAALRTSILQMLKDCGHQVIAARDGYQALQKAKRAGKLDLLITDLVMPGMSGRHLAERLTSQRPGFPVLYISGYHRESGLDERAILAKPFTREQLTSRIREKLREFADNPAAKLPRGTMS